MLHGSINWWLSNWGGRLRKIHTCAHARDAHAEVKDNNLTDGWLFLSVIFPLKTGKRLNMQKIPKQFKLNVKSEQHNQDKYWPLPSALLISQHAEYQHISIDAGHPQHSHNSFLLNAFNNSIRVSEGWELDPKQYFLIHRLNSTIIRPQHLKNLLLIKATSSCH